MKTKKDIINEYIEKKLDFIIGVNYDENGICDPYDIKLKDITEYILDNELKDYYYFNTVSDSAFLTPLGAATQEILEDLKLKFRKDKIQKIRSNVDT